MNPDPSTFNLATYGACVVGIVISVLLPPLWTFVRQAFVMPAAGGIKRFEAAARMGWESMMPYAALGAASALTALLLVAFLHDKLTSTSAAILAGYAWDSTFQKLK